MNKILNKQRTPHGWRGDARPAAFGAALAALLGFVLLVPTAWTEMVRPQNGATASTLGWSKAAGDDCKTHTAAVTPVPQREIATDAQFMEWAVAAHRSSAGTASFTALAAARALTQNN